MTTTRRRIDELLTCSDLGRAIDELSSDAPEDLAEEACARLLAGAGYDSHRLISLLLAIGEPGGAALRELLGKDEDLDRLMLTMLPRLPSPLRRENLLPFLRGDSHDLAQAAIGAAGFTRDLSLAPEVFRHWGTKRRLDAALCLGRLRARDYTPHLVELVGLSPQKLKGQKWEFAAVALEAMADPTCRPDVLRFLRTAPEERVWSLAQILRRISDVDQSGDWISKDGKGDREKLRKAWLRPAPTLGLSSIKVSSAKLGELLLHGTGEIRLGYPAATTAKNWPRWERALYWGDEVLFNANSNCPTCETYLSRTDTACPRLEADRIGSLLSDVAELSGSIIASLAPVLRPLPSGRYYLALTQCAIERIDEPRQDASWYAKRGDLRVPDDPEWNDPDERPAPEVCWPGTSHYQRTELLRGTPPTSMTILPTQPLQGLDEATVVARRQAIGDGQQPAALAIGWYEHRAIVGGYPEAMMQCVVLDGHHTLEAYAREGRPARLLLLLPWSFSWVPALREAIDLLR